jgi:hypothetical protein
MMSCARSAGRIWQMKGLTLSQAPTRFSEEIRATSTTALRANDSEPSQQALSPKRNVEFYHQATSIG